MNLVIIERIGKSASSRYCYSVEHKGKHVGDTRAEAVMIKLIRIFRSKLLTGE